MRTANGVRRDLQQTTFQPRRTSEAAAQENAMTQHLDCDRGSNPHSHIRNNTHYTPDKLTIYRQGFSLPQASAMANKLQVIRIMILHWQCILSLIMVIINDTRGSVSA